MEKIHRQYHEASMIFPLLQGDEFEALKADIAANGLLEAIWLHPNGSILDGRNRHRVCIETDTLPRFRTWDGTGSLVAFVVSMNLRRRHLTSSQRAVIALDILPMLEAEAKERQRASGGDRKSDMAKIPEPIKDKGLARDKTAALFQASPRYISDAKRLRDEAPDLLEEVRQGKKTISKAKRELVKRQREEQWQQMQDKAQALDENDWPESITLHTGDFAQVAQALEPESISLIITDPPYGADNTHLYGMLAREAARLLRPGGSLLAMAGQLTLPAIYNLMQPHLVYHWTMAYLTPGGQSPQIWPRKVNAFWKPILWFVKGVYKGDWQGDVVMSDANDKRFHDWGQSESGIGRLVSKFSSPGIVLDPFVGGGTVGVVCYRLRRPFIGIDIDAEAIETTRERILREIANERS